MPINILITSAGRRTSLVEAFQAAVHPRGGQVIAADVDGLAPSLFVADGAVRVPPIESDDYLPGVLDVVREHAIRLLVPTIDTGLLNLSANKDALVEAGCFPLVSSTELIGITLDKVETARFFARGGVRTPATWSAEEVATADLPDRLFIRPRAGSASQDAFAFKRGELQSALTRVANPVVQEELDGPEITVDVLLDFTGKLIHYVPRIRIRTMAGESIQGVTIGPEDIGDWLVNIFKIVGETGGIGPMTLQAFLTDRGPVLTEINPRFGGGFPLGLAAGGRYPEWIVDMVDGRDVEPRPGDYAVGLYMTRSAREFFVPGPKWE